MHSSPHRPAQIADRIVPLRLGLDAPGACQRDQRAGPSVEERPAIELTAGYVKRSEAITPSQGSRPPWSFNQSYALDKALLLGEPIDDGVLKLTSTERATASGSLEPQPAVSSA